MVKKKRIKKIAYQVNATVKGYRRSFTGYMTKRKAKKYIKKLKGTNPQARIWIEKPNKKPRKIVGRMKNMRVKKVKYTPYSHS